MFYLFILITVNRQFLFVSDSENIVMKLLSVAPLICIVFQQYCEHVQGKSALQIYLNCEINIKTIEIVDLIHEQFVDDLISEVVESSQISFVIRNDVNSFNSSDIFDHVVIFANDNSSFVHSFISTKSRYTIIFQQISVLNMEILFGILWKNNVMNINILKFDENCEKVYTFMPFQVKNCFNSNPMIINVFFRGNWNSTNFFPDKLKNLQKLHCQSNCVEQSKHGYQNSSLRWEHQTQRNRSKTHQRSVESFELSHRN